MLVDGCEKKCINNGSDPIKILFPIENSDAHVILQLSKDVLYPLDHIIPCLKYRRGVYIIPLDENIYYAITFPEYVHDSILNIFEEKLSLYCQLRSDSVEEPEEAPKEEEEFVFVEKGEELDKYSLGLLSRWYKRAHKYEYLSYSIAKTGKRVGEGLLSKGRYLKSYLEDKAKAFHVEKPTQVKVPHEISGTISTVRSISPYAVLISSSIVNAIGGVAEKIGKMAASNSKSTSESENKIDKTVNKLAKVGFAGFSAIGDIWSGLTGAGLLLFEGVENSSVTVLQKSYGDEVAKVVSDSFGVTKDVTKSVIDIKSISTIGFFRKTGKSFVKSYFTGGKMVPLITEPDEENGEYQEIKYIESRESLNDGTTSTIEVQVVEEHQSRSNFFD